MVISLETETKMAAIFQTISSNAFKFINFDKDLTNVWPQESS